jgi:phenylpropionate dioxygenase-like ring-hydroxylating dioxygenase large terminal subunit
MTSKLTSALRFATYWKEHLLPARDAGSRLSDRGVHGRHATPVRERHPQPIAPRGWYTVAFSHEVPPGEVRTVQLAGKDVVLYRTAAGALQAVDPLCPHLGAHLGVGSTVEGDQLRCPMHGFCFDKQGTCTKTGTGVKPPPTAKLKLVPFVEQANQIIVFHTAGGGLPREDEVLPQLIDPALGEPFQLYYEFHSHLQDIGENIADVAHFSITHGYTNLAELAPMRPSDRTLAFRYQMTRSSRPFGGTASPVTSHATLTFHGLGLLVSDSALADGPRLRSLTIFAMTPRDGEIVELRVSGWVPDLEKLRETGVFKYLPLRATRQIVQTLGRLTVNNDIRQDQKILNYKSFVPRPALAAGDGNIPQYRAWASKLYEQDNEVVHLGASQRAAE